MAGGGEAGAEAKAPGRGIQPGRDAEGPPRLLPTCRSSSKRTRSITQTHSLHTFAQTGAPAPRRTPRPGHPGSHARPRVQLPLGQRRTWTEGPAPQACTPASPWPLRRSGLVNPGKSPGARAPLQRGAPVHAPTCFGGQGLDRGAPQSHTRGSGLALPCHICVPSGKGPHPSKPSVLVCEMGALLIGRRRVRGAEEGEWWAQKTLCEHWLVFWLPDRAGH